MIVKEIWADTVNALTLDKEEAENNFLGENTAIDNMTDNLSFVVRGKNGSGIGWEPDDTWVINKWGEVTRTDLDEDTEVTLTVAIIVKAPSLSNDGKAVAVAKADLILGDTSLVTNNVTLPSVGFWDTTITWTSSDSSVITDNGKVTRPAYGQSNITLTLTVTITKGDASDTKIFSVTVKALEASGQEAVDADIAALSFGGIKGGNVYVYYINKNLALPAVSAQGSAISWVCEPDGITADGKITRPQPGENNKDAILTTTVAIRDAADGYYHGHGKRRV